MINRDLIPRVAARFKALSDPGRLEILAALQEGERTVGELCLATGRSQPNVSQHLAQLSHAGLVEARREGARAFYRISDPFVTRICDVVCSSVEAPPRSRAPRPAARSRSRARA
jgi:DNA-binding transcriptional ArsR family regulator